MIYVYVRWQPNHPWPEVAFSSGIGQVLGFRSMNEASGPSTHPQMWSVPVPNESAEAAGRNPYSNPANTPRTHAGVGVKPALHGENGPDSQAVSLCSDCGRPVTDDMAHTFCLTTDAT